MEDLRADGRIILKWNLKKLDDKAWTGITWFRKGKKWWDVVKTVMNCFYKMQESLDLRSNYQNFCTAVGERF